MTRCLGVLSAFFVACGASGVDTITETPLLPPAPQTAAIETAPSPEATGDDRHPDGGHPQIARGDLDAVLSRGPAGVLAMIQTEPVRDNGKFVGFRIAAFVPEAPSTIDLKIGDVLVAVNGQKIVVPDDYFRVFQELKVASELRFDVLRDGAPLQLVYLVVDSVH